MDVNTTFWIASCTKLLTTVAAMQCVERGLVSLDEDLSKHLPEFNDLEVLEGFEEGSHEPKFRKPENKITLRQLLTHSSGMGYDVSSPILKQWRAQRGEQEMSFLGEIVRLHLRKPS
jgi:CubicO group peptidase (beta-lactamase class C family)